MSDKALVTSQQIDEQTLQGYLRKRSSAISDAIPQLMRSTLTPERMIVLTMGSVRKKPQLARCSFESVFLAMIQAAQVGLEIDTALQHAWLIPRGQEAQFSPSYRGLIKLAYDCGVAKEVYCERITQEEIDSGAFKEIAGTANERGIVHNPIRWKSQTIVGYYAVIKRVDGTVDYEIMDMAQIEAVRSRSATPNAGPWVTDHDQQCKKTVYRRLLKRQPLNTDNPNSDRLRVALEADDNTFDIKGIGRDVPDDEAPSANDDPRNAKGAADLAAKLAPKVTPTTDAPETDDQRIAKLVKSGTEAQKRVAKLAKGILGDALVVTPEGKRTVLTCVEMIDYCDATQVYDLIATKQSGAELIEWAPKGLAGLKPKEES